MEKEEVAARRKALGLTQQDLALLWNVSRQTINRWENGGRSIDPLVPLAFEAIEGRSTSQLKADLAALKDKKEK